MRFQTILLNFMGIVFIVQILWSGWYIYSPSRHAPCKCQLTPEQEHFLELQNAAMKSTQQFCNLTGSLTMPNCTNDTNRGILITSFYDSPRLKEQLGVLQINLLNPYISKVILMTSNPAMVTRNSISHLFKAEKIEIVESHLAEFAILEFEKEKIYKGWSGWMRPWHRKGYLSILEILELANTKYENQIIIVPNNDISFDHSLIHLKKLKRNEFWSISRRATVISSPNGMASQFDGNTKDQCDPYTGSHDAFIFYSPFKVGNLREKLFSLTRTMGSPNVEQIWNYLAKVGTGRDLVNPCRSIVLNHHHDVRGKVSWSASQAVPDDIKTWVGASSLNQT